MLFDRDDDDGGGVVGFLMLLRIVVAVVSLTIKAVSGTIGSTMVGISTVAATSAEKTVASWMGI